MRGSSSCSAWALGFIALEIAGQAVVMALALAGSLSSVDSAAPDSGRAPLGPDWSGVEKILDQAIDDRIFPGCAALVFSKPHGGLVLERARGKYTYPDLPNPPSNPTENPDVTLDTIYDLASLTKVLAATTAAAMLSQDGHLDLAMPVAHPDLLGPAFAVNGKGAITVAHLLRHDSGFRSGPVPNFASAAFNCTQTRQPRPTQDFSCHAKVFRHIMNESLGSPTVEAPYRYSDLSMMTLMYVIGRVARSQGLVTDADLDPRCLQQLQPPAAGRAASEPQPSHAGPTSKLQCDYEAYVRKHLIHALDLQHTLFSPPESLWASITPTQDDRSYRRKMVQGEVHDPNTYAMGGFSGHAGLFSSARDTLAIALAWLEPGRQGTEAGPGGLLRAETVERFAKQQRPGFSSRALGWNTNHPVDHDRGWSLTCGPLSARTFMHTGYTGTMVCIDPENQVVTVLLTNRVHPEDQLGPISDVRRAFQAAVVEALAKLEKK